MPKVDFGPTVVGGVLQRTSASAMTTADPDTFGGCFRKWVYDKILGLREPDTAATVLGKDCHGEIEEHLKTGNNALSAIVMAGYMYLPERHKALEIEHNITPQHFYEVAGVPVVGMIDLINPTGRYINPMGRILSEDIVEVLDWKTTSDISYVKPGHTLKGKHQMVLYGEYSMRRYNVDRVRLSHVYFQTKRSKKAEKTTTIMTREESALHLPKMEKVVRTLIDLASETDINKVPANTASCTAYRGCYYSDRCPKTPKMIIDLITGNTKKMSQIPPPGYVPPPPPFAMSPVAPAATFPVAVVPGGVVAQIPLQPIAAPPSVVTTSVAPPLQAPPVAPPTVGGVPVPERPADFVAALAFVALHGYGKPTLAGEAQAINVGYNGVGLGPNGESPGEGISAASTVSSIAELIHLAKAVGERAGSPFVAPANILPDDAPASQPHLAADPVEGYAMPPTPGVAVGATATPVAPVAVAPPPPAALPPPAPVAVTAPPAASSAEITGSASVELLKCLAAADSGKFGSVKKPELITGFCELLSQKTVAAPPVAAPSAEVHVAVAPVAPTSKIGIYINCIRSGAIDLGPFIDAAASTICSQYGVVSLLAAPNDSALGYNNWKGILISALQETIPKALPPGEYYLLTSGDEIKQAAGMAFTPYIEAVGV